MLLDAILAGVSASTASFIGKLAFDENNSTLLGSSLMYRGFFFIVVVSLNALLFRFMAHGMDKSSNTVSVTAIVTGCNFICTGLFGWFLGEQVTLRWIVAACILCGGIYLIGNDK